MVAGSVSGPAYVGGDLFLARLIPGSDPKAQPVIAFSTDTDPKATINEADGRFTFIDATPADYALVVWNPATSFVVQLPNGGGFVNVKVEADKITDLGTIVIP